MHPWRYRLLLLGCLAIAGCIKSHPAAEEQPNPQPETPATAQARIQPVQKAEARNSAPGEHSAQVGGTGGVQKAEASNSASGFWSSPPSGARTYPPLGTVTRIEIKNRRDEMIRSLEGREQIQEIVAFVDKQRSGWGRPWAGVPVPKVVAYFYDGDTLKGHFGVGPNFFEAQREGDFASKNASAEQCQAFLGLIGVDKKVLDN